MYELFRDTETFNDDISNWDVSNVINMGLIFYHLDNFNQDLSSWNVSNVTNMHSAFAFTAFNQDLSSWDVSSVNDMSSMFQGATNFNGDISNWDVSNVTTIANMFSGAHAFNQDLSSWNVSNLESIFGTFNGASSFNQDLSSWNISNVTAMLYCFDGTALSENNQCAIHTLFSSNDNWPYDWSEYCNGTSIDSVCGNFFGDNIINGNPSSTGDVLTYLSGYGSGCQDPSTSYTGEDLASLYCGLAGYSSYVQFDVITSSSFDAIGTLAWTGPPYNDIQEATCIDLNWFGTFGAHENCPVIYNLVCE